MTRITATNVLSTPFNPGEFNWQSGDHCGTAAADGLTRKNGDTIVEQVHTLVDVPSGAGSIVTYGSPTYSNGVVSRTVTRSKTQAELNKDADAPRLAAFESDTGCIDTLSKFNSMTFTEFDQWFTDNVTTVAQARVALKRLAWVVLLLYKRKI